MLKKILVGKKADWSNGDVKTCQFENTEVAVYKIGKKFHAVENTCPHRGAPLSEGILTDKVIACPWHGWEFDVTCGDMLMNPSQKLKTFSVYIDGDHIYVVNKIKKNKSTN